MLSTESWQNSFKRDRNLDNEVWLHKMLLNSVSVGISFSIGLYSDTVSGFGFGQTRQYQENQSQLQLHI